MGNNLAKVRGKHLLTQVALAEKIGISKQGLSLNESEHCSIKVAEKVAEILHENVFEILGSDILAILPETEEDKEALRRTIKELLGE